MTLTYRLHLWLFHHCNRYWRRCVTRRFWPAWRRSQTYAAPRPNRRSTPNPEPRPAMSHFALSCLRSTELNVSDWDQPAYGRDADAQRQLKQRLHPQIRKQAAVCIINQCRELDALISDRQHS